MVTVELVAAYFLGLMPIYLMLARTMRDIGRLSADHSNVENKIDRLEKKVNVNDNDIDRLELSDD